MFPNLMRCQVAFDVRVCNFFFMKSVASFVCNQGFEPFLLHVQSFRHR